MSVIEGIRERVAERRLAGDGRAGSWARAQARRRQLRFLRDAWRPLAGMLVVAAAVTAGVAYLAPRGFWRGLAVGVLGTTTIALVVVLVLEATGTAAVQMGSTAERWTASELRLLRKHRWRLINGFLLGRFGDIDHLMVGPGGVIVAETKWWSSGWVLQPPDENVIKALGQVTRAAERVRLWAPVKRVGCPVRPVLFLWGRGDEEDADANAAPTEIRGVTVIRRTRAASHWREQVRTAQEVLAPQSADALTTEIRRHLARRDEHEAHREPALPSWESLYWNSVGCFLAGAAGIITMSEPLSKGRHWLAVAVGVVGIGGGLLVRRWKSPRFVADAWLAGVVGVGLLAAVIFALA